MRRNPEKVHHCLGIMPFLEASEMQPQYRRLRFILAWFWPVMYALALLAEGSARLLPEALRRWLMQSHIEAMDPEVRLQPAPPQRPSWWP